MLHCRKFCVAIMVVEQSEIAPYIFLLLFLNAIICIRNSIFLSVKEPSCKPYEKFQIQKHQENTFLFLTLW